MAFVAVAAGTADVTGMAARIAQLEESLKIALAPQGAPVAALPQDGHMLDETTKEKSIEECTDQELRDFIKAESGKPAPHNAGRAALLARATELATKDKVAA